MSTADSTGQLVYVHGVGFVLFPSPGAPPGYVRLLHYQLVGATMTGGCVFVPADVRRVSPIAKAHQVNNLYLATFAGCCGCCFKCNRGQQASFQLSIEDGLSDTLTARWYDWKDREGGENEKPIRSVRTHTTNLRRLGEAGGTVQWEMDTPEGTADCCCCWSPIIPIPCCWWSPEPEHWPPEVLTVELTAPLVPMDPMNPRLRLAIPIPRQHE